MATPSSSPKESSTETSTLPQNQILPWGTILFWLERALIFELILYAIFRYDDCPSAFLSYLCIHHGIATNFFYAAAFIHRQYVQPFSFEAAFTFYLERVGFLFAMLKGLGYMEKGLHYGVDILVTVQLYMIIEFLYDLGCYLKKKYYDIENSKIKPIVETYSSKIYQYAISPWFNFCKKALLSFWDSLFVEVNDKKGNNGVRESKTESKPIEEEKNNEDEEVEPETELVQDQEDNNDKIEEAQDVNDDESETENNSESEEEDDRSNSEAKVEEYDELKELRRNIEQHRAAEVLYEAQKRLLEKEKSNLLAENKRLQHQLSLAKKPQLVPMPQISPPPPPLYYFPSQRIQPNYEAEKKELTDKYNKLVQEKGSVEVELGFQKSLAEQYRAGMEELEGKYMEQREKNLELAGKHAAEFWMVNKLCDENGGLEVKCRSLEEERCHLMAELAAAKSAYEYYRTSR